MRYLAMQVLTWGTVAAAAGSAVLLATLGGAAPRPALNLSLLEVEALRPAEQPASAEAPAATDTSH